MKKFEVVSDGACDLSLQLLQEYEIAALPFYVSLDGKDYCKETELSIKDFYQTLINEDAYPKTSTPSLEDFLSVFEQHAKDGKDILCICATDTLTSSSKTAESAREIINEKYDCRIEVIHSELMTVAQGLFVIEAAKLRDKGIELTEAVHQLEDTMSYNRIIFFTGGTKYLQKGGRIGKVASVATEFLSIKPLIVLKDGEISPHGIIRSRKNGFKKLVSMLKDFLQSSGQPLEAFTCCIGVTYDVKEDAAVLAELFKQEFGGLPDFSLMLIGATVGAHTGPGTIGFGIVKKTMP